MDRPARGWYTMPMTSCERWAESLSALADGEEPELPEALVRAHAADCPACSVLVAGLRPPDDALAASVVRENARRDRADGTPLLRALVALCGAAVGAFALQPLVVGELGGAPTHDARHVGAFGIAFAVALLVAAWRPARARSVLPVAIVLAVAVAITALLDIAAGEATLAAELQHLPELLSVPLVWLLATPPERRAALLRRR
jgi:predicted anti-sigma-YlaC factor YlaD